MNPNSLKNLKPPYKSGSEWTGNTNGRPKAARDAVTTKFLNAMLEDFEKDGKRAIVRTREEDPAAYLRVIAAIIPKELTISDGQDALNRLLDGLADEQLAALHTALGLIATNAGDREAKTKAQAGKQPTGIH